MHTKNTRADSHEARSRYLNFVKAEPNPNNEALTVEQVQGVEARVSVLAVSEPGWADRILAKRSYILDEITSMPFRDLQSSRLFRSKAASEERSALSSLPYRLVLFTLIVAAMGAVSCVVRAQEKMKIPGQDWIQLFNGDNLDGWSKIGNESWTVEDGLIHGKGLTKDYGYLETANDYKDFQLSLRFKCVGDGNSGVFFHSEFKPGTADVTQGMQFEIDCKMMHHTAGVYAEDGREWVAWPAPENEGVVRMGEWNDYLLEVVGNRYRSRLNGVPMLDFTDPKPSSWDGKIALQLHAGGQGNMQFKDIWIRDLSHR